MTNKIPQKKACHRNVGYQLYLQDQNMEKRAY